MSEPQISVEQPVAQPASRPTTEMVKWLTEKSENFGTTFHRFKKSVENVFTAKLPSRKPEVVSIPSPERADTDPISKYLEPAAQGQRLSLQLKDQSLAPIFEYLDMLARGDTRSNPDYIHTFTRLANENSGRRLTELMLRLAAVRKSHALTPEQEAVVNQTYAILEEVKPQLAKNVVADLARRHGRGGWHQRFEQAKTEQLEIQLRKSAVGGSDVYFTFVVPQTADQQKVQVAIERMVTTWERFTKGSQHDPLLADALKKPINVPVVLLDDSNGQFRGMRSYAHMDQPGVALYLDDAYLSSTSMHEAIHAVIGAYAGWSFSSDFAEACSTYYNNKFHQEEWGVESYDKPQQYLIDMLASILESNRVVGISTTQALEQDNKVNPLDQNIRNQQKDSLQYVFGFFLMDALNKCPAMQRMQAEYASKGINPLEIVMRINQHYNQVATEMWNQRKPVRQRDLLHDVITRPDCLHWTYQDFEQVIELATNEIKKHRSKN